MRALKTTRNKECLRVGSHPRAPWKRFESNPRRIRSRRPCAHGYTAALGSRRRATASAMDTGHRRADAETAPDLWWSEVT